MTSLFLGSPAAAVPSLCALANVSDIELVITQPDRPAGRGRQMTPSPVGMAARHFGYPVATPEGPEELLDILDASDATFGLVVAYGAILSEPMLDTLPAGFLNVHFSLLPRWRGAAPVERAIAAGDERTGVTLMRIDEGVDTGPVIGEVPTPIADDETGGSLTARLAYLGASVVDATVPDYLSGRRIPVPQIDAGATAARRLTRADGALRPTQTASEAERAVRAFTPRPGAWLSTPDGALRVHEALVAERAIDPGSIAGEHGSVLAGFSDGSLELRVVQPEGRGRQAAQAWLNGRRGAPTSFVAVDP
jgi:methionyl-tRNA formyltransferase